MSDLANENGAAPVEAKPNEVQAVQPLEKAKRNNKGVEYLPWDNPYSSMTEDAFQTALLADLETVKELYGERNVFSKRDAEIAVKAGKVLATVKAVVGHGWYGKWLASNGVQERMAQRDAVLAKTVKGDPEAVKGLTISEAQVKFGLKKQTEKKKPKAKADANLLKQAQEFEKKWTDKMQSVAQTLVETWEETTGIEAVPLMLPVLANGFEEKTLNAWLQKDEGKLLADEFFLPIALKFKIPVGEHGIVVMGCPEPTAEVPTEPKIEGNSVVIDGFKFEVVKGLVYARKKNRYVVLIGDDRDNWEFVSERTSRLAKSQGKTIMSPSEREKAWQIWSAYYPANKSKLPPMSLFVSAFHIDEDESQPTAVATSNPEVKSDLMSDLTSVSEQFEQMPKLQLPVIMELPTATQPTA